MRAISLWQPWASAMALGLKHIETRHWTTSHRGNVAIHAAKRWTREERERWEMECRANSALPKTIPLGAIVATGTLVNVVHTEALIDTGRVTCREESWGNFGHGRYGWIFEDIIALPEPISFKGAQGFFNVPDDLLANRGVP